MFLYILLNEILYVNYEVTILEVIRVRAWAGRTYWPVVLWPFILQLRPQPGLFISFPFTVEHGPEFSPRAVLLPPVLSIRT